MKKVLLWILVLTVSIGMIVSFSVIGCKKEETEETVEEEVETKETIEADEETAEEAEEKTEEDGKIYFADINCLTGDWEWYGRVSQEAMDLYIDKLNASGGLLGREVEMIHYDTRTDVNEGVSIAKKVLGDPRFSFVFIGDNAVSCAAQTLFDSAKMPHFILESDPTVIGNSKYTFAVGETTEQSGIVAAEEIYKWGIRKLAFLNSDDVWANSQTDWMVDGFESKGGTVVASEVHPYGTMDFKSVITKMRGEDPELITIVNQYNDCAIFLKQMYELGWDVSVVVTAAEQTPTFFELAGDAAEGVIMWTPFWENSEVSYIKEFVEAYADKYGMAPALQAAIFWDSIGITVEAINKVGNLDNEAIRDAIATTEDYVGVYSIAPTSCDENGQFGVFDYVWLYANNGEWVEWKPEYSGF